MLVTVAQSKRELTPDIVKAALYGPASSKIPAPLPPAQPNAMGPRPPAQQPLVNSMAPRLLRNSLGLSIQCKLKLSA